jgi:predicted PurR-regulated permease PerM
MARLRRVAAHPNNPTSTIADKHLWEFKFVRDLFWLLAMVGIVLFCLSIWAILFPLAIALGLAYLFNPVILWLEEHWRMPRTLAVSLIMVVLGLLLILLVAWLTPLVVEQTVGLAKSLPVYAKNLTNKIAEKSQALPGYIPDFIKDEIPAVKEYILTHLDVQSITDEVTQQLTLLLERIRQDPYTFLQSVLTGTQKAVGAIGTGAARTVGAIGSGTSQALGFITAVISSTAVFALNVALIPFYFFFIAVRLERFFDAIVRFFPASQKDWILEILAKMDDAVICFFSGRVIIVLLMGAMFSFGWWLAGVPYWFLLGMMTGVLNMIPYVSVVGWPIAILFKYLEILTHDSASFSIMAIFIWPSVVFGVVQFLEGWFLTPIIQSRSTDLSMVAILIVVFMGGAVAGLLGLLLSIPVAACIKILWKEVLAPYFESAAQRY